MRFHHRWMIFWLDFKCECQILWDTGRKAIRYSKTTLTSATHLSSSPAGFDGELYTCHWSVIDRHGWRALKNPWAPVGQWYRVWLRKEYFLKFPGQASESRLTPSSCLSFTTPFRLHPAVEPDQIPILHIYTLNPINGQSSTKIF